MNLLEHCIQHQWKRVAFIGIAKHAGKTTALNGFLHQLAEAGETVGLLSVGVDGERLDSILGVPKPRVDVEVGTIVASAEGALLDSEARFDWLQELPISSPLGPVMVARVITPGTVVLAGIRQRAHVELASQALKNHGAQFVLVDGAFDRVAAATPDLVDAAVLAVGAVVGRTVEDVVQHASPVIARFQLPLASDAWRQHFAAARDSGEVAIAVGDKAVEELDSIRQLPAHAAMFHLTRQPGWSDDIVAVYIPGAVTDGMVDDLLNHPKPLEVVANHPVQVMLSGPMYRRLLRRGHRISVWDTLPLAAIAINPHHINGFDLPEPNLMDAIRQMAGDTPVYNALEVVTKGGDGL